MLENDILVSPGGVLPVAADQDGAGRGFLSNDPVSEDDPGGVVFQASQDSGDGDLIVFIQDKRACYFFRRLECDGGPGGFLMGEGGPELTVGPVFEGAYAVVEPEGGETGVPDQGFEKLFFCQCGNLPEAVFQVRGWLPGGCGISRRGILSGDGDGAGVCRVALPEGEFV